MRNKVKRAENVDKSLNKYINAINKNNIPPDAKKLLSTTNDKKVASYHKEDANITPAIITGGINLNDNKKVEKENKVETKQYNNISIKTKNSKKAKQLLKQQLNKISCSKM